MQSRLAHNQAAIDSFYVQINYTLHQRLLRRFLRFMPVRDVAHLIVKPFLGQRRGPTKAETLSRAVDHAHMKDRAAALTLLADDVLDRVGTVARAERERMAREAEHPLPA